MKDGNSILLIKINDKFKNTSKIKTLVKDYKKNGYNITSGLKINQYTRELRRSSVILFIHLL